MKRGSMVRPISIKNRQRIAEDPFYHRCARAGNECRGRITIEHALTYAGKRIDDMFALLPLCEFHHLGDGLDKRWNIEMAMTRATEEDKKKYPRLKWEKYQ